MIKNPTFLLWSNEHQGWWRPGEHGYTTNVDEAGRFSMATAIERSSSAAWSGKLERAVVMVAAPDNWLRRE